MEHGLCSGQNYFYIRPRANLFLLNRNSTLNNNFHLIIQALNSRYILYLLKRKAIM